ncbi:MAG TPA: CoA transferase, partial [Kofleriaceae bacterium]
MNEKTQDLHGLPGERAGGGATAWCGLDEAAATVADGAWISPGGFMLGRAPIALVLALIRARRRDLRILSLPNPLPAELLVAAGAAA